MKKIKTIMLNATKKSILIIGWFSLFIMALTIFMTFFELSAYKEGVKTIWQPTLYLFICFAFLVAQLFSIKKHKYVFIVILLVSHMAYIRHIHHLLSDMAEVRYLSICDDEPKYCKE